MCTDIVYEIWLFNILKCLLKKEKFYDILSEIRNVKLTKENKNINININKPFIYILEVWATKNLCVK